MFLRQYVVQADLELTILNYASWVLGLQACATMASSHSTSLNDYNLTLLILEVGGDFGL